MKNTEEISAIIGKESGSQLIKETESSGLHKIQHKMKKISRASTVAAAGLTASANVLRASATVSKPLARVLKPSAASRKASTIAATASTGSAMALNAPEAISRVISARLLFNVMGLLAALYLFASRTNAEDDENAPFSRRIALFILLGYMLCKTIETVSRGDTSIKDVSASNHSDLQEITKPTMVDESQVDSDESTTSAEEILLNPQNIRPYELAQLCLQSYQKIPQAAVGSWQFLSQSCPNSHGYYGVAYFNSAQKRVVIAHRGTDPTLMSNLLSDASLAVSKLPEAQSDAKSFSEEVRFSVGVDYEVIETGHSLGGFHAEMNIALLESGYAMSFESPGIVEMCEVLKLNPDASRFVSFFSVPNVINTAKSHMGELYQICAHRMDKNGLKLSYGSYLQPLTKAVMKAVTPVDSAVKAGMSILQTTAGTVLKRQVLHHSLDELIRAMHPGLGYPWLMRKVIKWPSLGEFLKTQAVPASLVSASSSHADNNGIDEKFLGYAAGDFVSAPLERETPETARAYRMGALKRFDAFYREPELRLAFIQSMGLSEDEIAAVPLPAVQLVSSSLSFASSSSGKQPALLEENGTKATPHSLLSPVKSVTEKPTAPAVRLANSLISSNHLIEENKWLVSLVKSQGDAEHAFLLLEGIRDGVPINIRTDFFLDLDARQEVVARLPMGIASGVNALWGSSESLVGRGFVRTVEIQPSEYEKLLGNCEHQSWGITREQADKLVERFATEARKPYTYAIVGNHPSSAVSSSSVTEPHNCVSWCQKILWEEFSIPAGSKWALIKRPSTIVRETVNANAEPNLNVATGSSSSFFSGSAMSSASSSQSSSSNPSAAPSKGSLADRLGRKGF